MKPLHKRLVIAFASIAVVDFAVMITMFANPDIADRTIPALTLVQILGFVAIAIIVVKSKRDYTSGTEADSDGGSAVQQWMPWLFGFIALMNFIRFGSALLYIAGDEGHKHSWVGPAALAASVCFFLWLAIKARRSPSRRKSKEETTDLNLEL